MSSKAAKTPPALCSGTPVSWLRLEQYHLGELSNDDARDVASHLARCAACSACLSTIQSDERALLPLPELPRLRSPAAAPRRRWAAPATGALAAAAALILFLTRPQAPVGRPAAEVADRIKGNLVAFALVREEQGPVPEAGGTFREGDRFKALVTCPPGLTAQFDLVVYDHGQASFPLAAQGAVDCGNEVALPGAFRLTGHEPQTLCLVWGDEGTVDRDRLRGSVPGSLPHSQCVTLTPAQ